MNHADLPSLIKRLDQKILATSGIDSFEEIVKILFLKLFDEISGENELFSTGKFEKVNKAIISADKKWPGILKDAEFQIPKKLLITCLKELQNIQILHEEASLFDSAIEYLLPYTHRGSRGQFMTPRHVVREIIQMISPQENERVIDPACGSGGFLEYSILFQSPKKREKYTEKYVYGIDYDSRMTRIARLVCLKNSASEPKVITENSLSYEKENAFDIVVSNPPYGGLISDASILENFEIAKNSKGKIQKTHRHILFIEKCIHLARPGGRIALILPQGVLNNARMKKIHGFIFANCRLVAVISLPQNTFMPHTNVKTSIVILQKWEKKKEDNYDVFMAVSEKSGKDRKGKIILKNKKIDHDLEKINMDFNKFKKSQKMYWIGTPTKSQ